MLYRYFGSDIRQSFGLLRDPDGIHGSLRRVMEEVKSGTRFLCEEDIFPYGEILCHIRCPGESELSRDPSLMHDSLFCQIITLTVTHQEHIMRLCIAHTFEEESLILDIIAIIGNGDDT